MKHLNYFFIAVLLFLSAQLFSQNNKSHLEFAQQQLEQRGEIYYSFPIQNRSTLNELSSIISLDGIKNNRVFAYANSQEFNDFLNYNIDFEPVYDYYTTTRALTMATDISQMTNWDRYPTHEVYMEMMNKFVEDYPSFAKLDTIGYSINDYPIVCLAISQNISVPADKPKFWWSATMHGDELAGYILMLRLADYLLTNYGSDAQATNILDNIVVYINPLANPDGTFYNSPDYTDVSQSIRNNLNNIDLNRNFPYINSAVSQNYQIQPEIQIMMDYSDEIDFTMGANGHGGIALINYPWDAWNTNQKITADHDWWQRISWDYANSAQANSPAGYFTGESGVTNGGDWYIVNGSRQDFLNYERNIREVTIEWSDEKRLSVDMLNPVWDYNKEAMLNYTEQILYGFRGIITDACSGEPIVGAKVEIASHDMDNSEVYSFAPIGNYHRLIDGGTYTVTFSADGYNNKEIIVTTQDNQSTRIDVELIPDRFIYLDFQRSNSK